VTRLHHSLNSTEDLPGDAQDDCRRNHRVHNRRLTEQRQAIDSSQRSLNSLRQLIGERGVVPTHVEPLFDCQDALAVHQLREALPSKIDMRAARGAGIPVYVLTLSAVSKTTGESSEVVMKGDWFSARVQE
jgi:hypothetical protein